MSHSYETPRMDNSDVQRPVYDHDSIRLRVVSGDLRFSHKRSRSKVWNVFARLEDLNGRTLPDLVICRTCHSIHKFKGCTSNMVRHKCYRNLLLEQAASINKFKLNNQDEYESELNDNDDDPLQSPSPLQSSAGAETSDKVVQALTDWLVENCLPLSLVQEEGLKKLAKVFLEIGCDFGKNISIEDLMPDQATMAWSIKNRFQESFNEIWSDVNEIKQMGVSITIGGSSDLYLKDSHIASTVHYVKEGVTMSGLLGISNIREGSFTDNHLLDLDLDKDEPIFIISRPENIPPGFENRRIVYCISNLINQAVEMAFKTDPLLKKILSQVLELFREWKPSNPVPTASLNCYHMFSLIETNWLDLPSSLDNDPELLQHFQLSNISLMVNILAEFDKCCQILSSDTQPTLHLVIPHIHRLNKLCAQASQNVIESRLKVSLQKTLNSAVLPRITKYHQLAQFLFPPTNKLLQCSDCQREEIIEECKSFMRKYSTHDSDEVNVNIKKEPESLEDDLFSDFVCLDIKVDKINKEIRAYSDIQMPYSEGFNVLQWWHSNKEHFPLLFKTSCKILATPASSKPAEIILTQARTLITDQSCTPRELNEIMFLTSFKGNSFK